MSDEKWKSILRLAVLEDYNIENWRAIYSSIDKPINESRMIDDTRRRTGGKVSGIKVLGE